MAGAEVNRGDGVFERALAGHGRLAAAPVRGERPGVAVNMVSTVDGHTTVGGRVGELTSAADQQLLRYLRAQADAVLVGANTIRQEGYGTLRSDSRVSGAGEGDEGAQPWLCIVSQRLAFPPDVAALQNPDLRILVITSSDQEIPDARAQIEYLRQPDDGPVSLRWALRALRAERGIERVVCEGGPTLNAWLFTESCVDDLFVALSPRVLGDQTSLTLLTGSLPSPVTLALKSHLVSGDFMFLRYGVA